MIKLSLTKDKLKSTVQMVHALIESIRKNKNSLNDWPLIQANAHLYVLDDLSRRMRSKLVLMEDKSGIHPVKYSINEIQAMILISYNDILSHDSPGMNPYSYSLFKEISGTLFQKLLS